MLDKSAKNRIWIITITVVAVSMISGPLTGKGSDSQLWKFYIPLLMSIGLSFLYALLSRDMIPLEKIILPPIIGTLCLFMAAIPYDRLISVLGCYEDDYDHVTNVPMANLIFYVPCVSFVIFCLYLFERFRRQKKSHSHS